MKTLLWRRVILLSLASLIVVQAAAAAPDGHPVQAELVADVTAVAPGDSLTLGVVLRMAPGWHTYWAYSGDAGLATSVEWQAPAGVRVGDLRWPGPHRYMEAGDLIAFGYAEEVMLMAPALVPPASAPDSLRIKAAVSWLVCLDICIPGEATLSLVLPPGVGSAAHRERFALYGSLVPRPLATSDPLSWDHEVRSGAKGDLEVTVRLTAPTVDAETPDFFPLPVRDTLGYIEAGPRVAGVDGSVRSSARLITYAGQLPLTQLPGVAVFTDAEGHRQYRNLEVDLRPTAATLDLLTTDFRVAAPSRHGLWLYLAMAAVGGLILNLMPCVLPVISLKALSLASQAGASASRIRVLGLAFVAGVVASFLSLAIAVVLLRAGGEQVGWGFQFQSPAFVLFLTSLVFVLSLSLFGVVNIRLPGASSLGGPSDDEGVAGSFANGVLATILATPCTAPFLGTALGFAFSQPAAVVFAIFTATGFGMASPYLLLAWRPGWGRYLPRPGAWMERFRQGMGFLLVATVLWLLWVLGKQLGMEAVVWTAAFLLCLAIGTWVLGVWIDLRSSPRQRLTAWLVAVLVAVAGYAAFLHPLLTAPAGGANGDPGGDWEPFEVGRVEELIGQGRIVFIDFTAEWCWTCKVNERAVLADPEVRARFADLDVALIKADWTNRDPEITQLLHAFGRPGVPLYVIFPGGRADEPLVLPEVITGDLVIERLDEAAARSAE